MLQITESQEWVHHERGGSEPSLIRKFQKVAWDLLFKGKEKKALIHDLNHKYLPSNLKIVIFDLESPEECFSTMKELFSHTDYDIHLTLKPK